MGPKSENSDSKYSFEIFKSQKSNSKRYRRRPQIKKFYKTDPPKSGNYDSRYNFKIFKNQKKTQKRTPKVKKIKNIHEELSNKKVGIIIQNTILVWFGIVWDLLLLKRGPNYTKPNQNCILNDNSYF